MKIGEIVEIVDWMNNFYDRHYIAFHIVLIILFVPQSIADPNIIYRAGGIVFIAVTVFHAVIERRRLKGHNQAPFRGRERQTGEPPKPNTRLAARQVVQRVRTTLAGPGTSPIAGLPIGGRSDSR